jgi:N-acetylneuraminate synthase/N,N'-diacetyllegionaminate synthase
MKIIGLIPARGGSKRLPGKNTKFLGPLPLIAHTIRAALASKCLDRVIVSTDDSFTAELARRYGAEAPWLRPKNLASDKASVVDAVLDALTRLDAEGRRPDAVLLLQPTSPFRSVKTIRRAVALFKASRGQSVISVTPAVNHPLWCRRIGRDGVMTPFLSGRETPVRSQELEPAFVLDGSIYLTSVKNLAARKSFLSPRSRALITPAEESLDIDTPRDWERAERLWVSRPRRTPGGKPRAFIIAEAGVNHNGDLKLAKRLVNAAKAAGADAVKFQSFHSDSLATRSARTADYQRAATRANSQFEMLKKLELSEKDHAVLFAHCRRRGILFMSTPFDTESADLLERLGVDRFKIGSGEITNRSLLEHVARKGRPIILSTGMSTLDDVRRALGWIGAAVPVTLLHCVTQYPLPVGEVNLRAMDTLRESFGLPVGYSDHTQGIEVPLAAAARGAVVIEKHLTLDRGLPGPDHRASLEPAEFKAMVRGIRDVEACLGDGVKRVAACEAKNRLVARRSLVAARDLPSGHVLLEGDLLVKRPGTGIPPAQEARLLGRRLRRAVKRDDLLSWKLV